MHLGLRSTRPISIVGHAGLYYHSPEACVESNLGHLGSFSCLRGYRCHAKDSTLLSVPGVDPQNEGSYSSGQAYLPDSSLRYCRDPIRWS